MKSSRSLDRILHVYDTRTRRTRNLSLSAAGGFEVDGHHVAAVVIESFQGNTDLNDDGDTDDFVFHLIDARNGAAVNTALVPRFDFSLEAGIAVLGVSESGQGNADLNDDGDDGDSVIHVIEGRR